MLKRELRIQATVQYISLPSTWIPPGRSPSPEFSKQDDAIYLVRSDGHAVYQTHCVGGGLPWSLLNWRHQALRCTAADEVAEQSLQDNIQEANTKQNKNKGKWWQDDMATYAKIKGDLNWQQTPRQSFPCFWSVQLFIHFFSHRSPNEGKQLC